MSAYNYRQTSKVLNKQLNFNRSEQLALKNGFEVVLDEKAYNGRYFVREGKIWIHNISALKKQLRIYNNKELELHGYDVKAYFETH